MTSGWLVFLTSILCPCPLSLWLLGSLCAELDIWSGRGTGQGEVNGLLGRRGAAGAIGGIKDFLGKHVADGGELSLVVGAVGGVSSRAKLLAQGVARTE